MSASVASKNLYELLGNDPPEEPQASKAPREVVKKTVSSKKVDEKPAAAAPAAGRSNNRRPRPQGNDAAFRDREAGSANNRQKNTDESGVGAARGGGRGGPGGRGGRGGRRQYDRHDATGRNEHEKQAALSWGANEGQSEWKDEVAGSEIAQKELTEAAAEGAANDEPAEEEGPKTKTYEEYLAELQAKKAELGGPAQIRKPNEGSRDDKKWANAKELTKDEGEAYIPGDPKDKTRTRERKQKQILEVEMRFVEPAREQRGRGERGDRGGRGGRGDRGDRPRGGRGGDRAPRGDRPARGGRPAQAPRPAGAPVNITDEKAFPTLGA